MSPHDPTPEAPSLDPKGDAPPPPESAPAADALAKELEDLRAKAAELEGLRKKAKERDDFLALAQRVQADFANYQKRIAAEKEGWQKFLMSDLFKDLLPAMDAFDACVSAAAKDEALKPHLAGFQIAMKELLRVMEKNGLKPIAPAEGEFDPARHEAVGVVETADRPEGHVAELMRKGWTIHGRVLRPAQVKVTRKPAAPDEKS